MKVDRRSFLMLVGAVLFLAVGMAALGWASWRNQDDRDKDHGQIVGLTRQVGELQRQNSVKDQQLRDASIPPSPLLTTTTTTIPPKRTTTATTARPRATSSTTTSTSTTSTTTVVGPTTTTTTTQPGPPPATCLPIIHCLPGGQP